MIPKQGRDFLHPAATWPQKGEKADPYAGSMYRAYRKFLVTCIRFRWITVAVMGGLLVRDSIKDFMST